MITRGEGFLRGIAQPISWECEIREYMRVLVFGSSNRHVGSPYHRGLYWYEYAFYFCTQKPDFIANFDGILLCIY